jgi:hypothetical protein
MAAMRAFAYKTDSHREAMQQKIRQNWYWEELFARFVMVGSEGSYQGTDPLKSLALFSPSIQPAAH